MKKIGYILYNGKLDYDANLFEQIDDINKAEKDKPLLIIGYNDAKQNIPNFSILNKHPSEKIYWTFKKTEKREDYLEDINNFYKDSFNAIFKEIKYYYVDILTIKYSTAKKIYELFKKRKDLCIYFKLGMVYVYVNKSIIGISLELMKYCKIDYKRAERIILNNKSSKILTDKSVSVQNLQDKIKKYDYIIPYLNSF